MTGAEFSEVDIDLLADYVGGVLTGTPEESAVATRIADDPAWRAAYESLSGGVELVRADLSRLGAEELEPMPADLAARLDEMFATPPASPTSPAPQSAPRLTVVDGERADGVRHIAPRRRKWLTPIAVAAGMVFFVGFGADYLAGRDQDGASDQSASSAAGSAERETAAGLPDSPQILSSGTDYSLGSLAVEPVQALNAPQPDSADPAIGGAQKSLPDARSSVAVPLARLVPVDALRECIEAIQRANGGDLIAVQSVDYARFEGTPAVVVRFSATNGQWAWASGPECGASGGEAATLGKVPVR